MIPSIRSLCELALNLFLLIMTLSLMSTLLKPESWPRSLLLLVTLEDCLFCAMIEAELKVLEFLTVLLVATLPIRFSVRWFAFAAKLSR